jgi:hypothetical protein
MAPLHPPLSLLRALRPPAVADQGIEGAVRWEVFAGFERPRTLEEISAALSAPWRRGQKVQQVLWVDLAGEAHPLEPHLPGESAEIQGGHLAPPSPFATAVVVRWDLLAQVDSARKTQLEPGRWVIVRSRPDDFEALADEDTFAQRLSNLRERLRPLQPARVEAQVPPGIAAERARGLERLRRTWGSRLHVCVAAPPAGWNPWTIWGVLTTELGLQPLPEARLGWVVPGSSTPIFEARGWDPPDAVRPPSEQVHGIQLSFQPATHAQPMKVAEALFALGTFLSQRLDGQLCDETGEELDLDLLRAGVRLVLTGLAGHGLRPGSAPTGVCAQPSVGPRLARGG